MTEYYARKEYVYDGGDRILSIPFSYTDKKYIKVLINDEITSEYEYLNDSQIVVNKHLITGDIVTIVRETPIKEKFVTFTDTSILSATQQNLAQDQVFDAIQEIYDNNKVFKNETNNNLANNKQELENIIESNKQEFLGIQSDFEDKVNTKIQQVSDAAEKINELEEAVNTAVNAANTATSKADSASAEANKATEQASLATKKAHEITDIAEKSLANIESKTQEEINKIKQTGFYMQNDKLYYINSEGNPQEFKQGGGGLELATIVCMPFGVDESENKYRYLNGQVIIQEQYPAFTAKVKSWQATRPNLFTTEQNWQAEKTASKLGQSGKFVVDNTAGTIRLPLVININGLTDLANCGLIKNESLPNITLYQTGAAGSNMGTKNGALIYTPGGVGVQGASSSDVNSHGTFDFNASRSSSTYQDNAPVQQEAIQYPYVIVVNTGVTETERPINNYQVNNVYSYGVSQYYKGTMNNNSWLRSAGQWNNGTIYNGLYGWILEQLNNSADGFATSDSSYTDYDWVINTTDQTFRLPLKNGMEGVFASGVKGNGITLGLTDGTDFGGLNSGAITTTSNILFARKAVYGKAVGSLGETGLLETARSLGLTPDPTKSGIVVDTTVPEGWNLYYYVGDVLENSDLVNIARLQEELVDIKAQPHIVETYVNGTSGYRVWSDGYCEQWGRVVNNADVANTVTFIKPYKDTNYYVTRSSSIGIYATTTYAKHSTDVFELTTKSFKAYTYSGEGLNNFMWLAKGYIV